MVTRALFFRFFHDDWLRDTRPLSPYAKGVWIDIICLAWSSATSQLQASYKQFSRMLGADENELRSAIEELRKFNIAEISEDGDELRIECRRMREDLRINAEEREKAHLRAKKASLASRSKPAPSQLVASSKPAPSPPSSASSASSAKLLSKESNSPKKSKDRCTIEELTEFGKANGLTPRDVEFFWNHWTANDWTNNGKAIKDWRATIRSWGAQGYWPSQKAKLDLDYWPDAVVEVGPTTDPMLAKIEAAAQRFSETGRFAPEEVQDEPEPDESATDSTDPF